MTFFLFLGQVRSSFLNKTDSVYPATIISGENFVAFFKETDRDLGSRGSLNLFLSSSSPIV